VEETDLIGPLSSSLALEAGIDADYRPMIFPTSDDSGSGTCRAAARWDAGQVAVILGNSAVVNSSSAEAPASGSLDAMRLNWGRIYGCLLYNGAQFLGSRRRRAADWEKIEARGPCLSRRRRRSGDIAVRVAGAVARRTWAALEWRPSEPTEPGCRFRASLEALAYLIARGVKEHEVAGQNITRITVSAA